MTNPATRAAADSRDSLRARIDAAERRNAERTLADQARDASTAAVEYTRANPLTVIGGALAAGLVIGLLTRPGRRVAAQAARSTAGAISDAASSAGSGVKKLTSHGGSQLGRLFGEATVAAVMTIIDDALNAANSAQDRAGELGEAAGAQAKKLGASAAETAETAADSTRALARKTRDTAADMVRDFVRKTKG